MKIPEMFLLTKREQRVVIIIVMALLVGAIAKHYYEAQSHSDSPGSPITQPMTSPMPSPPEDE